MMKPVRIFIFCLLGFLFGINSAMSDIPKEDFGETGQDLIVTNSIRKFFNSDLLLSVIAEDIVIYTTDGTVHLYGALPTQKTKELILKMVKPYVPRLYRIQDEIEIKPDLNKEKISSNNSGDKSLNS